MSSTASTLSDWAQVVVAVAALLYAVLSGHAAQRDRKTERIAAGNQRRVDSEAEEKDRRLRAKPVLDGTWTVNHKTKHLRFVMKNVGLGPAEIIAVRPSYKGTSVDELNLRQIGHDFQLDGLDPGPYYPTLTPGTWMAVGEEYCLLDFVADAAEVDVQAIKDAIRFDAVYCSIYGDEFNSYA